MSGAIVSLHIYAYMGRILHCTKFLDSIDLLQSFQVVDVELDEVLSQGAYMLLYSRCSSLLFLSINFLSK